MNEQATSDDLVTLGEFQSTLEASLVKNWLEEEGIEASLDGAATANWLNYIGPDLVGARLSVKQSDLARAQEVLEEIRAEKASHAEDEYQDDREPVPTPPLIRAYRAAVIGTVILPPLLSLYSLVLVVRHRLWEPQAGETATNWRFYATIFCQMLRLLCFWWIVVVFRS